MKIHTLLVLCVATVLLASTAFVTPVRSEPAAQAPVPDGVAVRDAANLQNVAATYDYWTPERMAAAQPMPLGEVSGSPGGVSAAEAVPAGEPGFLPGFNAGEPMRGVLSAAQAFAEMGAVEPQTVVGTPWYLYPFPYTWSYMGAGWPGFYPMRTNGKLFFTQGVTNFVCSGTVVAGDVNLVATAGHCVHKGDGATWSTNLLFCPAYWSGAGPWGCWAAINAATLTDWSNLADWRDDHGFMIAAATNANGWGQIGSTIGTNGLAWNYSTPQEIWSFGYPASSPYTGTTLVWTTSGIAELDDAGISGPFPMGIGSDQTGGSSGGAWSIGQRIAAPGYVISHNDFKYTTPSRPLAMYGPYQGDAWKVLFDFAVSL